MKKGNVILVLVVACLAGMLMYFMPSIYKWNQKREGNIKAKKEKSSVIVKEEKETNEKLEFDKEVLNEIVYPTLRVNNTSDNYFKSKEFNISNLSNNDILAIALKNVYEGYIEDYGISGCATQGKKISADYLDVRIKNIINKKVEYTHQDFTISDSKYSGLWKYDTSNNIYIYNGDCNPSKTNYYDLNLLDSYEVSDNNKTLVIISKVAFAKVENNHYIIYQDVNMTQELSKGTFTSVDDLNNLLKNLNTKKYQYTYKQGLCSYDSYCLEKGNWING